MTKYRAKEDVPPGVKKGDVVEFSEPLVGSFASRFERANDDDEVTTAGDNANPQIGIVNPDRNALKALATDLGINFAQNIPTDRLMELIQEAEAKRQSGDGNDGSGDGDEE